MSYEELKQLVGGRSLPLTTDTADGACVVIEQGCTEGGLHFYKLSTAQENGWLRVNCYYADGQMDETYER